MITEAAIMRQRRRPHRSGLLPKGALAKIHEERYRANPEQYGKAASEQQRNLDNMTTDIEIPQTEAGTGSFYQFAPDVYEAVVASIEEVPNPYEEGQTQLQFTFEVPGFENEDGSVASKIGWANPVFNAKSKLWGWASAILGAEPEKGVSFRTSTLIGKPCRIVLNAGKSLKGDDIIKITDVLGPQKAASAKKASLTDRLKTEPPKGAEVVRESIDYCSDKECKRVADGYTSKGTPFCDEHMP